MDTAAPIELIKDKMKKKKTNQIYQHVIKEGMMEKIFGAKPVQVPQGNEDNPLGRMLKYLDEKSLIELNLQVCELYNKELAT